MGWVSPTSVGSGRLGDTAKPDRQPFYHTFCPLPTYLHDLLAPTPILEMPTTGGAAGARSVPTRDATLFLATRWGFQRPHAVTPEGGSGHLPQRVRRPRNHRIPPFVAFETLEERLADRPRTASSCQWRRFPVFSRGLGGLDGHRQVAPPPRSIPIRDRRFGRTIPSAGSRRRSQWNRSRRGQSCARHPIS